MQLCPFFFASRVFTVMIRIKDPSHIGFKINFSVEALINDHCE